jgi:hypothetical protein
MADGELHCGGRIPPRKPPEAGTASTSHVAHDLFRFRAGSAPLGGGSIRLRILSLPQFRQ